MLLSQAKQWKQTLSADIQDLPQWEMLSDDQLVAIAAICKGDYDCVSLLGAAGSGKTFVVKFCKVILKLLGTEVRVTASTGVASKNADGEGTVNRFAALGANGSTLPAGLFDVVAPGHRKRSSTAKRAEKAVENFNATKTNDMVVFVDEFSMLTSEDFVVLYEVVVRCNPNRRIRWVLTGDPRQLLFVPNKDETPWITFGSLAYESARFHCAGSPEDQIRTYGSLMTTGPFPVGYEQNWKSITISLVTNHRQENADAWFINALRALGDGHNFNHPDMRPLTKRVWVNGRNMKTKEPLPDLREAIHLYNRNVDVASHNAAMLDAAIARGEKVEEYTVTVFPGSWTEKEIIDELTPIDKTIRLATGLKFMVRINIDSVLTNGTIGEIIALESDRIQIKLPNGETHWINEMEIPLPKDKYGNPVGRAVGIPGVLAHALTPWKAQGLTFNEPMVYHLNNWYSTHGLMNVVCSRVTQPEYLFLEVEDLRMLNKSILCNQEVKSFIQMAEDNMHRCLGAEAWKPDANNSTYVWVRDHRVKCVDYVQNPKGEVILDNELCKVFWKDGFGGGMYVKDKEALGEVLLLDDEVYEWFADQVKFIWFDA